MGDDGVTQLASAVDKLRDLQDLILSCKLESRLRVAHACKLSLSALLWRQSALAAAAIRAQRLLCGCASHCLLVPVELLTCGTAPPLLPLFSVFLCLFVWLSLALDLDLSLRARVYACV